MRKREQHKGSSNVFADIGLPNPDQALAKAELARQIGRLLSARGLTQAQAADLLGLDQPKVSALLRGLHGGFSTERLFRLLTALGRDVQIVIKPARSAARAHVSVRAVGGANG